MEKALIYRGLRLIRSVLVAFAFVGSGSSALGQGGTLAVHGTGDVPAGPTVTDAIAVDLNDDSGVVLRLDGTLVEWGNFSGAPTTTDAVKVELEEDNGMVLNGDGTLQNWGQFSDPVPAGLDDVVDFAMGLGIYAAIKSDGSLVMWGQLLDVSAAPGYTHHPESLAPVVDVAIGLQAGLALHTDGTVTAWSSPDDYLLPPGMGAVSKLYASLSTSGAILADGSYQTLESPPLAQLDFPSVSPLSYESVAYHSSVAVALVSDGTVRSYPSNPASGQSGVIAAAGGGSGSSKSVATISASSALPFANVMPRSASKDSGDRVLLKTHVTGIVTSYQWRLDGADLPGEVSPWLMIDSVAAADAGNYTVILANEHGSYETAAAALLVDDDGGNSGGGGGGSGIGGTLTQYGTLIEAPPVVNDAIKVELGYSRGCAIRADGSVVEWGTTTGLSQAPAITDAVTIFTDGPFSLVLKTDGSLDLRGPSGVVPTPVGIQDVVDACIWGANFVAIKSDGSVIAWGDYVDNNIEDNGYFVSPPAGLTDIVDVEHNWLGTYALKADGTAMAWPAIASNTFLAGLSDVIKLSTTVWDFAALKSDGTIVGQFTEASYPPPDISPLKYVDVELSNEISGTALVEDGSFRAFPEEGNQPVTDVIDEAMGGVVDLDLPDLLVATITSPDALPYAQVLPASVQRNSGPVLFKAHTTGVVLSYQWKLDGVDLPGETKPWLYLANVGASDHGDYTLAMTNAHGTFETTASTLLPDFSNQVITFDAIGDQPFDAAPINLTATADSGLPVTLEIVTGPAALTGNQLSLTGTGTVTVRATQAGDGSYQPAAPVEHSFLSGYELTIVEPVAGGSIAVLPLQSIYAAGSEVTLNAVGEPSYALSSWTGDLSGAVTPQTVTMDAHRSVSAEFDREWQLNVSSSTGGSVTVSPVQVRYFEGDQITLTPVPDAGYELASWSGDITGSDVPLSFTLSADTSVHADFADVELPTVQIFSPAGGTTNNEVSALFGMVSDNTSVASMRWERDGEPAGDLGFAGGTFSVTGLVLNPGENVFTVYASDPAGNEGSNEVVVTWNPDRTLALGSPPETREGKQLTLPMTLESGGLVSGMTYVVSYEQDYLLAPEVLLVGPVASGVSQINTDFPGQIRITFSLPATTLPAGIVELGTATFRARSVPFDLSTTFGVNVLDVSGSDGQQINIGTFGVGSEARITQRNYTGDINTNDVLDTGDAFLMQRMLTGFDPVRAWDHPLNDLNGSNLLDSGDVTRVLRTIVGIDAQPGAGARQARNKAVKRAGKNASGPDAHMELSQNFGSTDEEITLSVRIDDLDHAPAAAAFTLDYPADALRLTDFSSHQAGDLVAAGSAVLWNVAPDTNNYSTQSGSISFVASSSQAWPGADQGGVLAELTFKVQPGASAEPSWPITLRDVELPTSDGFDVINLAGSSTAFIGQPATFSTWSQAYFTAAELADPAVSGPGADPDQDGSSNLIEYGTGGDPTSAGPSGVNAEIVSSGGSDYLAIEYPVSLTATDLNHRVQISNDLRTWTVLPGVDSETTQKLSADGMTEVFTVRELIPIGASDSTGLRVEFELITE